jgi:hypothetical protein
MTLTEIKTGMTLENTNSTILVKVISVEKYGFTAKEIGNCQGYWDGKIGEYSLASVNAGSWKIK